MKKYPMNILETSAERIVHFAGPEDSSFADFTEVIPDLSDTTARAQFLRKCDRQVEAACGNVACNELAGFTYDGAGSEGLALEKSTLRTVTGVYVSCDALECPLNEAPAQSNQLPVRSPGMDTRFLPARIR